MSVHLEIESTFAEALRQAGLTSFDAFMRMKTGSATSKHAIRETAPLEIAVDEAPRRFFIKRNFRVPPKHALIPLLRFQSPFSQPRREWEILWTLREASIPAMGRVAMGEKRIAGIPVAAFLLVEAVPMQWTLENWLVPGFPRPSRLSTAEEAVLLEQLGKLVSRLDGAGLWWPDIHPKHIFAAPQRTGAWNFCLIDVERMRPEAKSHARGPGIPRSLRTLIRNLRPMHWREDSLAALIRGYGHADSSDLAGCIEAEPRPRLPDDYDHPRAVPLMRRNRILMDERAAAWLERAGITTAKDVLDADIGESMNKPGLDSHRERIRLNASDGNGTEKVLYLKRYRRPPAGEQIKRMIATGFFRGSAYHEMHFAKKLALIGIPTMRSIAYGQVMKGFWERGSFGVTEGLPGRSLEQWLNNLAAEPSTIPPRDRHEIARQLGLLVRLLHANRFFHRDLYLCHVFLTRNRDGGMVLSLIDLARMIEKPMRTDRWRIKDLASLQYSATRPVTRTDRMRFMKAYYGVDAPRGRIRRDVHEVAARTARIAAHDARRRQRHSGEPRD